MLKTFAKASGLLFQQIDANSMSAAGYIGDSFGKQWVRACAALDENPDRNILIFVDEVDKLFAQAHTSREGTAIYDLLKPLEGGILEGSDDSHNGTPYALDCDRCIFVMAGAFTGIEDIIASRIGISRSVVGFSSAAESAPSENDLSEDGLRARVSLEDVEAWGCRAKWRDAFPRCASCSPERRCATRDCQAQQAERIRPHASCGRALFHRYRSRRYASEKRP
ncbi:MAG: hypothetical protein ACLTQI_04775 [Slackia sp.]